MNDKATLPIRVIVSHCETSEQVHNRVLNHNNRNDRTWLARTTTWALNNSHDILITPDLSFEYGIDS